MDFIPFRSSVYISRYVPKKEKSTQKRKKH
nr:MAG TPA: hypothetical protein [Caudoviricetes sp.]